MIASLRLTLEKLEQNFDSLEDEPAMSELKRILLLQIADLEALEASQLAQSKDSVSVPRGPADESEQVSMDPSD